MHKLKQKGATFMETLAATVILTLILLYVMNTYSSAFNMGTNNRDAYFANMIAANQLEKAKWTIINTQDYSAGIVDQGTISSSGVDFEYTVRLESIPGLSDSPIYQFICDVSWKDKTVSLATLISRRMYW
mgnify:CR=1 FL=1